MKKDTEVKLLMQERRKGTPQQLAAARAGMSERTARKYEQAGPLPSHLKRPHTWATRSNPFEEHWPWVVAHLERDPALQGSTWFALLCEQHPECYRPTQVRTLQRHIAKWRAVHGPEQEVIFEQRHQPGERAQSDFTHREDLGVTIAGKPFPHMVYHFVLTYSNAEAVSLCFSETFEALAEGIEKALWQLVHGGLNDSTIGGKPRVRPFDGFCHRAIIVVNKRQNLVAQVLKRGEIPPFEELAHQNREPNLHLVHPGRVFWSVIKHHPMPRIMQESGPAFH
jgi:hypothetical protein